MARLPARKDPAPRGRIGDLAMVWRHARRYPGRIAIAGGALVLVVLIIVLVVRARFRAAQEKRSRA